MHGPGELGCLDPTHSSGHLLNAGMAHISSGFAFK